MKITDVILPKIINYYVSDSCSDKIKKVIINSCIEKMNNKLILTTDNDIEVFDALRLIRCKTERITLGDQRKYEYELDISAPNAHLFNFILDDGDSVNCTLIAVNNLENNDLHLIFMILKE